MWKRVAEAVSWRRTSESIRLFALSYATTSPQLQASATVFSLLQHDEHVCDNIPTIGKCVCVARPFVLCGSSGEKGRYQRSCNLRRAQTPGKGATTSRLLLDGRYGLNPSSPSF